MPFRTQGFVTMGHITLATCFLASLSLVSCSGSRQSQSNHVSVSPSTADVAVGQKQLFSATETGNSSATFTWQVNGITGGNSTVGAISQFGFYTAPSTIPNPATVTIAATDQANTTAMGSATVTVGPIVSVSPPFPVVQTYGTQQFSATVTGGASNTTVSWQVSCQASGSACGTISQAGLYQAPNSVPTAVQSGTSVPQVAPVMVTAVSNANPSFSGAVLAQITSLNQQPQSAPIILGTSGSNINNVCVNANIQSCLTGTLGALLTRAGSQYILSNYHVLARPGGGTVGDAVIQPGLNDGQPMCSAAGATIVATLSQLSNPQTETGTKADAALAAVTTGTVDSTGLIQELGSTVLNGVPQPGAPAQGSGIPPSINELVAKSGRSTGLTCANVEAINVSINIQYSDSCLTAGFTVSYSGQVTIRGAGFSAGGDSGSLIVDASTAQPVALLFAADATTSTGNPVADVLNVLKDANGNLPSFVGGSPHIVAACNLPNPASAIASRPSPATRAEAIHAAEAVKNRHESELLSNSAVMAIGAGPSLDAPGEAAVLLFVRGGSSRTSIPTEIEGVRTRTIESEDFSLRGSLDQEQTSQLASQIKQRRPPTLSRGTTQKAILIKEKYALQLMRDPAIQGVGVSASLDSPGDAALIVYTTQGKSHSQIPITIDGLRTRLIETTGFYAGAAERGTGRGCSTLQTLGVPVNALR